MSSSRINVKVSRDNDEDQENRIFLQEDKLDP